MFGPLRARTVRVAKITWLILRNPQTGFRAYLLLVLVVLLQHPSSNFVKTKQSSIVATHV